MDVRPPMGVGVSAREAEVLAALAEHLTNAEISARLFISVRTVESHVSSLLRKFQVPDRRALVAVAGSVRAESVESPGEVVSVLPSPLTPLVGRVSERAELAQALRAHRLVAAVGPGGVGKSRLALSVVADVADLYPDGAWFVDLVPVTDPDMIAPAIAAALGLGEHHSRSAEETILGWLAEREALLVLDNCEHLLDGVTALVERLLAGSPGLTALVTSRARLLVPFEWVFPVPGLSVDADRGDAVQLFLERAAAGGISLAPGDSKRVAAICRGLDGMALAIELAAARVPSLGLDGIEAGLADRLDLLTSRRRHDDRHRSLRSALDWSYALLGDAEQAVLRRVSVFAAPFGADAAAAVVGGWKPVPPGAIAAILAALADHSLVVALPGRGATRYRALETIRQYGLERLDAAGEAAEAWSRHLDWSVAAGAALGAQFGADVGSWRSRFDEIANDLRAAHSWAAAHDPPRAYRSAILLAELTFARGMPGESQRRYEQAAAAAPDDRTAAVALSNAAGAAESRHFGNDAIRLRREAADAALRAGDHAFAGWELAMAAELINRGPGLLATLPPAGELDTLMREAWALSAGDPRAQARTLTAQAFTGEDTDPATLDLTERALALARQVADPLAESAALDQLTSIQLATGQIDRAARTAMSRAEVLASVPMTAASGLEHADSLNMAAECAVATGDLATARRLAERVRDLPFHSEEGHLATSRLIVVATLDGSWDEALVLAERFREGWERGGRPRTGSLTRGAYAAATIFGLRGDDAARAEWLDIVDALATPNRALSDIHFGEFFDAWLLLHRGLGDQAMRLMTTPPEQFRAWFSGMWRPWYAALWAEAAAVTEHEDAPERIDRARHMTLDNPIAAAIVERAAALIGDRAGLDPAAAALAAAGCRYQWARTLVFMGGSERTRGEDALAGLGATPMAVPRG